MIFETLVLRDFHSRDNLAIRQVAQTVTILDLEYYFLQFFTR